MLFPYNAMLTDVQEENFILFDGEFGSLGSNEAESEYNKLKQ